MMQQLGRYESFSISSSCMSASVARPASLRRSFSVSNRAASVGGVAEAVVARKDDHHVFAKTGTSSAKEIPGKVVTSDANTAAPPPAAIDIPVRKGNFFNVVKAAAAAVKEAAAREAALQAYVPIPPNAAIFEGGTRSVLQAAKEVLLSPRCDAFRL